MNNWFEFFSTQNKLNSTEREIAAIWLDTAIMTSDGIKHSRITSGDEVRINRLTEQLADVTPQHPATHRIIACYGTLNSATLSIQLLDLATNQPSILKLK